MIAVTRMNRAKSTGFFHGEGHATTQSLIIPLAATGGALAQSALRRACTHYIPVVCRCATSGIPHRSFRKSDTDLRRPKRSKR